MATKYKIDKIIHKKQVFNYSLLVDTAILLGEIMLKNGAETNRVEEAVHRLLKTTNMKHVEVVVMTTSIIVTLSDPSIDHITAVSRIHERTINLNRINLANLMINKYCNQEILFKIAIIIPHINAEIISRYVPFNIVVNAGGTKIKEISFSKSLY